MSGDLTLISDVFSLDSDLTITNTGNTTIKARTDSSTIGIGDGASGDLQLSDAELGLFNVGSFTFGSTSGSGKMTVIGTTWSDDITLQSGIGEIALTGSQNAGANNFTINGGSLTGGQDISANNILLDIDTSLDVGTLTSSGATTVSFDQSNKGSSSGVIGSIGSGGDINIRDGTGADNIITLSGVANAGTSNASLKADSINILDTLTANIITLDATGAVTAKVSTDDVLNLSASSASLTGKINGGRGLRAALFGINTLNFTGGNPSYRFGVYEIGFNSMEISNRMQGFEKDFNSKYYNLKYYKSNLFDYDDLIIDKRKLN